MLKSPCLYFSYQKQQAVLVSHTHSAGAHLASLQTGGRMSQSDGALSPAPVPHMHTAPCFRLAHTNKQNQKKSLNTK